MYQFKMIELNRILWLIDTKSIEQFCDEFPHLFISNDIRRIGTGAPRYTFSHLENDNTTEDYEFIRRYRNILKRISIELIIQHYLTANTLQHAKKLEDEAKQKTDALLSEIQKGFNVSNDNLNYQNSTIGGNDFDFCELRKFCLRKAQNRYDELTEELKKYDDIEFEVDEVDEVDDIDFVDYVFGDFYNPIFDITSHTIKNLNNEIIKR